MELLTVKQISELYGCGERRIRQLIQTGEIYVQEQRCESNGHKQYVIPVTSLPQDIQTKYYARFKTEAAPELAPISVAKPKKTPRPARSFDEYSAEEREEIALWTRIIEAWLECRTKYDRKTDADPLFVSMIKIQNPRLTISVDILYRKWAAYKASDVEGLLDHRGGWNRGQSGIPDEAWNWFLTAYLDERQLSISQCYELTQFWVKEFCPELLDSVPSERTFRRKVETISKAVVTLGREGSKAFSDRCAPYIVRMYDDLQPKHD